MTEAVKRRYDNSRRQAQVRTTRLKVIEAAKRLFTDHERWIARSLGTLLRTGWYPPSHLG